MSTLPHHSHMHAQMRQYHPHYQQQQQQQQQVHQQQQSIQQAFQKLAQANEQTWLHIGNLAETMGDMDRAIQAYEAALRHNPYSIPALTQIAASCRAKEQYSKAIEFFQRILNIDSANGETWGALGHCYLMLDDLGKAYNAYQQALHYLPNPQEPRLWYGIGILYDRSGSWENAEDALTKVLKLDPKFEKANEVYFRLGLLYRMLGKFESSLQCFRYILQAPPRPLTEIDIWFQIGCVYELQKDFVKAKEVYERVLHENPTHVKVLQQLGWLYQQPSSFQNTETAFKYLTKAVESDQADHRSWFLLGRVNMAAKRFNKAYDAYQQAIYRENRNPMYWCSIGVLYFEIGQQRDALDAYTRAIRINPYVPEVWFNLGVLYESCNNQVQDAVDAYTRALEVDPQNQEIQRRIQLLKQSIGQPPMPEGQSPAGAIPKATEIDPNHPRFNPYNPHVAHHQQMYKKTQSPPSSARVQVATQNLAQGGSQPPSAIPSNSSSTALSHPVHANGLPSMRHQQHQAPPPPQASHHPGPPQQHIPPNQQHHAHPPQSTAHVQHQPLRPAQQIPPPVLVTQQPQQHQIQPQQVPAQKATARIVTAPQAGPANIPTSNAASSASLKSVGSVEVDGSNKRSVEDVEEQDVKKIKTESTESLPESQESESVDSANIE